MAKKSSTNPLPHRALAALVYALNGRGKTLEVVRAAPRGLYLIRKGALRACSSFLGYEPPFQRFISGMTGVASAMEDVLRDGVPEGCARQVIADDIGTQALIEMEHEKTRNAGAYLTKNNFFDGRKFWGGQSDRCHRVVDAYTRLLAQGYDVFFTAHEGTPDVMDLTEGDAKQQAKAAILREHGASTFEFTRGGIRLAAKTHREFFCDPLTHAVRVIANDRCPEYPQWPKEYECDTGSSAWIQKDRDGVFPASGGFPCLVEYLRLGETLNRTGSTDIIDETFARPPELAWMAEWVAWYAAERASGVDDVKVDAELGKHLEGVDPRHTRWVRFEGRARYEVLKSYLEKLGG